MRIDWNNQEHPGTDFSGSEVVDIIGFMGDAAIWDTGRDTLRYCLTDFRYRRSPGDIGAATSDN